MGSEVAARTSATALELTDTRLLEPPNSSTPQSCAVESFEIRASEPFTTVESKCTTGDDCHIDEDRYDIYPWRAKETQ